MREPSIKWNDPRLEPPLRECEVCGKIVTACTEKECGERGTIQDRRERKRAEEAWNQIEHLLIDECGLRADEGLVHQRQNCINAILSAIRQ